MKTLIVYYSYTGKTETVAREIAGILHADLLKIEDSKPRKLLAGCIFALLGLRSSIKPLHLGPGAYDRVFIGTPVWAGYQAPAVNEFIATADLAGKIVIPFATMGASKAGRVMISMMKRLRSRGAVVQNSFTLQTSGLNADEIKTRARDIVQHYRVEA